MPPCKKELLRIWKRMALLKFALICLSATAFALLPCQGDAAELTAQQEKIAHEIYGSVMSPFCAARTLQDCPSGAAQDLKNKIRSDLASGKSKEEIVNDLLSQFGDKIRTVPATKGFGLLGWLAPLGFLLLGGIAIYAWVRMRAQEDPLQHAASNSNVDPEMERRIQDELSKF